MASYLQWDEEDMFHHLCASLKGAVGQVLWDISPPTTADIICFIQTRFGTQLQAGFKTVTCKKGSRRVPQQLYHGTYDDW